MSHGFDEFVEVIAALRAPDGCPWDREQTHRSIAKNMVEVAYEAVHAIETDDIAELRGGVEVDRDLRSRGDTKPHAERGGGPS